MQTWLQVDVAAHLVECLVMLVDVPAEGRPGRGQAVLGHRARAVDEEPSARLGVEHRRVGDFGRASRPNHGLPLGPDYLAQLGAWRVSPKRPGERAASPAGRHFQHARPPPPPARNGAPRRASTMRRAPHRATARR